MGENASGEAFAGGRGGALLAARYERSTYLVTNQSRKIPHHHQSQTPLGPMGENRAGHRPDGGDHGHEKQPVNSFDRDETLYQKAPSTATATMIDGNGIDDGEPMPKQRQKAKFSRNNQTH